MPGWQKELYLDYHCTTVVQTTPLRRILQTSPRLPSTKGLQLKFLPSLINSYLQEGTLKPPFQTNLHFHMVQSQGLSLCGMFGGITMFKECLKWSVKILCNSNGHIEKSGASAHITFLLFLPKTDTKTSPPCRKQLS